jgi:hypothetical protein
MLWECPQPCLVWHVKQGCRRKHAHFTALGLQHHTNDRHDKDRVSDRTSNLARGIPFRGKGLMTLELDHFQEILKVQSALGSLMIHRISHITMLITLCCTLPQRLSQARMPLIVLVSR